MHYTTRIHIKKPLIYKVNISSKELHMEASREYYYSILSFVENLESTSKTNLGLDPNVPNEFIPRFA